MVVLDRDCEGGDPDRCAEINGQTVYISDYTLLDFASEELAMTDALRAHAAELEAGGA